MTTITVGAPGGGGPTSAIQAIQRVVSDESDSVEITPTGTGGDPATMRLFDDGEINAATTANNIIRDARNGEGVFNEELTVPNQGFTFFRRDDHYMALDGTGIETTEDMRGARNWLLPPQWGSRALLENMFESTNEELYNDWFENVVNIGTGDLAGAVAEGRVDAFNAYGINGVMLPTWVQEADARGAAHYVEVTEPVAEVFKENETVTYYDDFDAYGWEQDIGTDTFTGHWNALNVYWGDDIPADAVQEVMQITYDHFDRIREGFPATFNYPETPEAYVTAVDESLQPVHPGCEAFYKEIGVWQDGWPTQ
jgi:TRAP-type uncharacterized transport system substrate-binding protein